MQNLTSFLRHHAQRRPTATALIFGESRIGYGDLYDRVLRLAACLHSRGVAHDDVVAVVMKNSPAFVELAFAVSHIGAIFLPINYRLAAQEVAYILGDAQARIVFVDEDLMELARDLDTPAVAVTEAMQADMRNLAGTDIEAVPAVIRRPHDLLRLMYTSGTTDRPKGVMHDYANFYWKCMDHVIELSLTQADRLCVVGPLYHVGAFDLPGLAVLWVGGSLTLIREYRADTVLRTIERDRASGIWMAPVISNGILNDPRRMQWDVSSLRWCIAGGERTPESVIREFGKVFTNARYIDAYGLTETGSGDTMMPSGMEIVKIGSVGLALTHVEIEIRNDEGQSLPPNTEGEICVRGAKVSKGYWRDPARTDASRWPEDWFRSGDVGYLDDDGYLYLTDRKKDMIISGGENIASSELERVLYELPQISEVAVIGRADPRWGERPVAIAVLKAGAELDYPTLESHCHTRLARFKCPQELHIVDALPRNPSGKILKRILREQINAG